MSNTDRVQWEYLPLTLAAVINTGTQIETGDVEAAKIVRGLNVLGSDGWELAAVINPLLFFKRPVHDPERNLGTDVPGPLPGGEVQTG